MSRAARTRTRRWRVALALPLLLVLTRVAPAHAADPDLTIFGRHTAFGSSVQLLPGENYADGIDRIQRVEGRLDVARIFQFVPAPIIFPQLASHTGIISFKLPPAQVLRGDYDREFRAFFAAAPRDHVTWWSYYHEADVAYHTHQLRDLDQFRKAYTHVALLAHDAGNPRLKNAVILVGYSSNPRSGVRVAEFMPRHDLVDVVAWDDYDNWFTDQGRYGDPRKMLEANRRAAAQVGKPFAVAEFGALVIHHDTDGRAAWITRFSRDARADGALFVSYYNSNQYGQGPDYRLLDRPSQRAYRAVLRWDGPGGWG